MKSIFALCIAFVSATAALAQVVTSEPRDWEAAAILNRGDVLFSLDLSHNAPAIVADELLDTNVIRLAARAGGLRVTDLATVAIMKQRRSFPSVELYQIGKQTSAFEALRVQLESYAKARNEGHTKAFAFAALAERATNRFIPPALLPLFTNTSLIAISWLKTNQSGFQTNKAGDVVSVTTTFTVENGRTVTNEVTEIPSTDEIRPWVEYVAADGDIAWRYWVQYKSDGSFDRMFTSRYDAKDVDPKFREIMASVEKQIDAEMKKDGTYGKFGSVHHYWSLKAKMLAARGIRWRSPGELNRNTNYD